MQRPFADYQQGADHGSVSVRPSYVTGLHVVVTEEFDRLLLPSCPHFVVQRGKGIDGIHALNLGTLPVYVGFDPGHHLNVAIIVGQCCPKRIMTISVVFAPACLPALLAVLIKEVQASARQQTLWKGIFASRRNLCQTWRVPTTDV